MAKPILTKKIKQVLGDDTLSTREIQDRLKELGDKRTKSFCPNSIGQLMRQKCFEKVGWHKEHASHLWRNKNAMD